MTAGPATATATVAVAGTATATVPATAAATVHVLVLVLAPLLTTTAHAQAPPPPQPPPAQETRDDVLADEVLGAKSECMACHASQRDPRLRAPAEALVASVHGKVDLTCHDCHGGRPGEPSARAHDPRAGFRSGVAAASAADNPAGVCGACHAQSEPTRKRPPAGVTPAEGSPLAQFLASRHATALAADRRSASCADCHGFHDVRAVDDPEARTSRAHVAETCGHCHANAETMQPSGLPHDQLAQWKKSVHGRRFAADPGDPEGRHPPTCTDCHGNHEIALGEAGIAGCEHCHEAQWTAFDGSPHATAFAQKGFLPCVDCHGSHEVQPAGPTLIGVSDGATCHRCHAEGQEMFPTIVELSERTHEAEALAARALAAQPVAVAGDGATSGDALRDTRGALRLAIHALDVDALRTAATRLEEQAAAQLGEAPPAHTPPGQPPHDAAGAKASPGQHPDHTGRRWLGAALLALGLGAFWMATRRRGGRA